MNSQHSSPSRKTCRICLCQDDANTIFYDILNGEDSTHNKNMFTKLFADVKLYDRNLPFDICSICFATTNDFYKMWKIRFDIQKKFQAQFKTVTNTESSSKSKKSCSQKTNSDNRIDDEPSSSTSYQMAASTTTPTVNRKHHVASSIPNIDLTTEPSTSIAERQNNEDPGGIRLILTKDKNDFKVKQPKKKKKARSPSPVVHKASSKDYSVPPQKKSKLSQPNSKKVNAEIVSPKPQSAKDKHHVRNGTSNNQNGEKNVSDDDMWEELSLAGKESKVYHCKKCNLLLMNTRGKDSHKCNTPPALSVTPLTKNQKAKRTNTDRSSGKQSRG